MKKEGSSKKGSGERGTVTKKLDFTNWLFFSIAFLFLVAIVFIGLDLSKNDSQDSLSNLLSGRENYSVNETQTNNSSISKTSSEISSPTESSGTGGGSGGSSDSPQSSESDVFPVNSTENTTIESDDEELKSDSKLPFDSDGGYDVFKKGNCTDDGVKALSDECTSKYWLYEYYVANLTGSEACTALYHNVLGVNCSKFGKSYRCIDGACVSDTTEYIPTDSDGGLDYDVKGVCFDGSNYSDVCSEYLEDYLYEAYLYNDECDYKTYSCAFNGGICIDGACVDISADCNAYCTGISRASYTSGICINPEMKYYNATLVCQENYGTYLAGSAGKCGNLVCCCK